MQDPNEIIIPKGYTYEESFNYLVRILNGLQDRIDKLESNKRRTAIVQAMGTGPSKDCPCGCTYTGMPHREF